MAAVLAVLALLATAPCVHAGPPCGADTDANLLVNVDDLINVLLDWGSDGARHGGDIDGSGNVDVDDLVQVLLNWGPCPTLNDDCIDALPVTDGVSVFATLAATSDGPPHDECGASGAAPIANDIWYVYTAPGNGLLHVSTCSDVEGVNGGAPFASFDTALAVYGPFDDAAAAGCDAPMLVAALLGCNDDDEDHFCGAPDGGRQSDLLVPAALGQQYLIRLGSAGAETSGTGAVLIELVNGRSDCAFAAEIETDDVVVISTCQATVDDTAGSCGPTPVQSSSVWLRAIGDGTQYTISLCAVPPGSLDTRLAVFCGRCDEYACVAPEPHDNYRDCGGGTETLTWCTVAGAEYQILVHAQGDPDCGFARITLGADDLPCDDPPCYAAECSGLAGQPRALPGNSFQYLLWSDTTLDTRRFERFDWPGGDVSTVRVWGFDLFDDGRTLFECIDKGGATFDVAVYADDAGAPDAGAPLCEVLSAPALRTQSDVYPGPINLLSWMYTIDADLPCGLPAGTYWLSVQASDGSPCAFSWLTSPVGDQQSYVDDGTRLAVSSGDLSFCVNPNCADHPPCP